MEEKQSVFNKVGKWIKNSVTLKLISIGILILIMLIPVEMIEDLIYERKGRMRQAVNEVSEKWGRNQIINGPILTLPYEVTVEVHKGDDEVDLKRYVRYLHVLPNQLDINGDLNTEIRERGIYQVPVYSSALTLSGKFVPFSLKKQGIEAKDVLWDKAFISVGISDLRGVQEEMILQWNEQRLKFEPGVQSDDLIKSGVSANLSIEDSLLSEQSFRIQLNFNGSKSLRFVPLGRTSTTQLKSDWADPKFSGSFLPDSHKITKEGFTADWKVLHLNRNYPQVIKGTNSNIDDSYYGLDLYQTMTEYKKNERTIKYAILFIALTFLVFFFIQILHRVRIHPIQYLMVGLSLCVFYTLLLAMSEQIGFGMSYVLASAAVIGLITLYAKGVIGSWRLPAMLGGMLTILYGYIYSLIQLRDIALLMGSIGLFLILATVMYLSRKINWYKLSNPEE